MAESEVLVELRGGDELAKARQGQSGASRSAELAAGSGGALRRGDPAGQTGAGCGGSAFEANGNGKASGGRRPESPSPPAAQPTPAKRARMDGHLSSLNEASQDMFGSGVLPLAHAAWTSCEQPVVAQHLDFRSGQGNGLAGPSKGRCKAPPTRIKLSNFSVQEDINVVTSWLQVSCDPGTNIGQKREPFWDRVVKQYNANRGTYPERGKRSINGRFDVIKGEVRKFSRYMEEILCRSSSAMSDVDKTAEAAAQFAVSEKHNFSHMHCWNILKDEPKWLELKSKELKSRTARDEEEPVRDREHTPQGSNSIDHDTDLSSPANSTGEQPLGLDAAGERPLGLDAAGERPLGMDAAVEQPIGMDAAGERPLVMDAAGEQPLRMDATGERPLRMDAAGERPVVMDAAGERPLVMDAAGERPLRMDTVGERPLRMDAAARRQPLRMDVAKEAHKKSALAASPEYASKLYDFTLGSFSHFKEMEAERKSRLAMIVSLEKETVAELREHRLRVIELEERRLAIEAQRLEMKRKRDEKAEDERILAINLDNCLPAQRLYYQALQEEIIAKIQARRHT